MNYRLKIFIILFLGLNAYLFTSAQAVAPAKTSSLPSTSSTTKSLEDRPSIIISAPDYNTIKTDEQIAVVVEAKVAERVASSAFAKVIDTPAAREDRHALQRSILAASTLEERELILFTEIAIETVISEKAAHEAGVAARLAAPTLANP